MYIRTFYCFVFLLIGCFNTSFAGKNKKKDLISITHGLLNQLVDGSNFSIPQEKLVPGNITGYTFPKGLNIKCLEANRDFVDQRNKLRTGKTSLLAEKEKKDYENKLALLILNRTSHNGSEENIAVSIELDQEGKLLFHEITHISVNNDGSDVLRGTAACASDGSGIESLGHAVSSTKETTTSLKVAIKKTSPRKHNSESTKGSAAKVSIDKHFRKLINHLTSLNSINDFHEIQSTNLNDHLKGTIRIKRYSPPTGFTLFVTCADSNFHDEYSKTLNENDIMVKIVLEEVRIVESSDSSMQIFGDRCEVNVIIPNEPIIEFDGEGKDDTVLILNSVICSKTKTIKKTTTSKTTVTRSAPFGTSDPSAAMLLETLEDDETNHNEMSIPKITGSGLTAALFRGLQSGNLTQLLTDLKAKQDGD